MSRDGHFPFWRPITITLLIAVIPTALYFGAKYYTTMLWGSPAHKRAECVAAAGMAAHILRTKDLLDPAARKAPIQFDHVLRGPPTDIFDGRFPEILQRLRAYLLMPSPLDCREDFAHLPNITGPVKIDTPVLGNRVHFSRLLFGASDDVAHATIAINCGNVCGEGWQTTWRRKGDDWSAESVRMLWIS